MPDEATVSGEMLELVRVARGLTQGELGTKARISQSVISKLESGLLLDDGVRATALAEALDVPVGRLSVGPEVRTLMSACAFHRKRSSLPVSQARRLRATLELTRLQIGSLFEEWFGARRPPSVRPSEDGYVSPEDIARQVRLLAEPSAGPLNSVTALAESLGVGLVELEFEASKLDAIGTAQDGERPLILLNKASSGDRRRFTLAHEIGHVVMHTVPAVDQEREADRFASELLMPAASIAGELDGLTREQLPALKKRWGVSMAAVIRRSRDLGSISDWDYKNLNVALSTAGYRTREPIDIPAEPPMALASAIRERLATGQPVEAIAADLLMTPHDFLHTYGDLL